MKQEKEVIEKDVLSKSKMIEKLSKQTTDMSAEITSLKENSNVMNIPLPVPPAPVERVSSYIVKIIAPKEYEQFE